MHAKQLAKLEGDSAAPLSPAATPFTKDPKSLNSAQTEGTNYRLLYSGGKLFWRTGDDIEFDIYFHVLAHCVEVIAFHSVKNKEWRVYLDYEKILAQVSGALKDAIQKRTQDDRKKQSKFSVAKESTDAAKYDQIVEEECKQQVITNYILNRMQLSAVSAATPTSEVQFVPTAVDVPENSPLRAEPPIGLIPISVNRRRKSSSDEITQSINAIQTDYADLKAATARAEKVSTLVFESANTLTSFLKKSNLSKWAKKWVWAIKLVIRRKHVALMTLRLEELEKEKAARKSNPKAEAVAQRRSHGS